MWTATKKVSDCLIGSICTKVLAGSIAMVCKSLIKSPQQKGLLKEAPGTMNPAGNKLPCISSSRHQQLPRWGSHFCCLMCWDSWAWSSWNTTSMCRHVLLSVSSGTYAPFICLERQNSSCLILVTNTLYLHRLIESQKVLKGNTSASHDQSASGVQSETVRLRHRLPRAIPQVLWMTKSDRTASLRLSLSLLRVPWRPNLLQNRFSFQNHALSARFAFSRMFLKPIIGKFTEV